MSSSDSHAVLKLATWSPSSVPNTNALGPSLPRRCSTAARRPFGSNGIRRFSLSFVVTGNPDCVSVPVHSLVLDEEHLPESAAQLEGADDAVVHQETDPAVLPFVHGDGRIEQPFLLVARDPPIPHGLRLHVQPTPKRWKGDLSMMGGVCACPQRMDARK